MEGVTVYAAIKDQLIRQSPDFHFNFESVMEDGIDLWKCNFPRNHHIRLLVGWSVGWSKFPKRAKWLLFQSTIEELVFLSIITNYKMISKGESRRTRDYHLNLNKMQSFFRNDDVW